MSYTVRKVKSFEGMEGLGFNAELVRDGKPVAFVIDEGNGGCFNFRWYDHSATMVEVPWVDYKGNPVVIRCTPEEAALHEAIRGKTWESEFSEGSKQMDLDMFVGGLVDEHENDKRFRRLAKTKTLYRVAGQADGVWNVLKAPFSKRIRDYIVADCAKAGKVLESIYNETIGQVAA